MIAAGDSSAEHDSDVANQFVNLLAARRPRMNASCSCSVKYIGSAPAVHFSAPDQPFRRQAAQFQQRFR